MKTEEKKTETADAANFRESVLIVLFKELVRDGALFQKKAALLATLQALENAGLFNFKCMLENENLKRVNAEFLKVYPKALEFVICDAADELSNATKEA